MVFCPTDTQASIRLEWEGGIGDVIFGARNAGGTTLQAARPVSTSPTSPIIMTRTSGAIWRDCTVDGQREGLINGA